jgi:hypothetical protein
MTSTSLAWDALHASFTEELGEFAQSTSSDSWAGTKGALSWGVVLCDFDEWVDAALTIHVECPQCATATEEPLWQDTIEPQGSRAFITRLLHQAREFAYCAHCDLDLSGES